MPKHSTSIELERNFGTLPRRQAEFLEREFATKVNGLVYFDPLRRFYQLNTSKLIIIHNEIDLCGVIGLTSGFTMLWKW